MSKDKKVEEGGFLPSDYREPEGNYMSFKDGDNTFRVLSSAVTGFEYWTKDKKPVRSRTMWATTPADIGRDEKGKIKPIKHFWVFVVYNRQAEKVQVLEITQKSVMSAIKSYVNNKAWGDPKGYDITVNKSGSGFDTEYIVMANPHSPAPEVEFDINLEAIFEKDGDMFGGKNNNEANREYEEI